MPLTIVSGPVIAAGESLSNIVNLTSGNTGIARIAMPAEWKPAWLTFQVSQDGAVFWDLYFPNGSPVVVTVIPGSTVVTNPEIWQAAYFRFRSGTADSPIIQPENCNFTCMLN